MKTPLSIIAYAAAGLLSFVLTPCYASDPFSVAGIHLGMNINDAFESIRDKYDWELKQAEGISLLCIEDPNGSGTLALAKSQPAIKSFTDGQIGSGDELVFLMSANVIVGRIPLFVGKVVADSQGKVAYVKLEPQVVNILFNAGHLNGYQFAALFREAKNIWREGYPTDVESNALEYISDDGTKIVIGKDKTLEMTPAPSKSQILDAF